MVTRSVRMWLAALLVGCWSVACGSALTPTAAPPPTRTAAPAATAPASLATPVPPTPVPAVATPTAPRAAAASPAVGGGSSGPTLRILSPQDGAQIALPATVRYEITGFAGGLPAGVHLHAELGNPTDGYRVELELAGLAGETTLPDDKSLPGRRDLTFVLVRADHTPYPNPLARATVRNLLIVGRR